ATKRTPSERSKLNSRRAVRFLALDRLEEADAVRRPVREERDADDPFVWDRAPEAAVVRGTTVVPHHEVVAGRNNDRLPEIAGAVAGTGGDIRVLLTHAVANHVSVHD